MLLPIMGGIKTSLVKSLPKKHSFGNWRNNMSLLKWAAVLMPAFLFVLLDMVWRAPFGSGGRSSAEFIWSHVAITVTIIVISYTIYNLIYRLQASIIRTNRDSAIVQERERTAREMHDGMGQLLGYINTQIIVVRTLLTKGQLSEACQELTKIEDIAHGLYADIREEILGLRVIPDRKDGLIPSLREYVARYAEMSGIKVAINVATGAHCPQLNPSAEIQLIRIVQEALTNVRKHAKAAAAEIIFERNGDELCLTITDNGCGFDMNNLSHKGRPRFGLQVMKERAEAIGGHFSIESSSGKGCRVAVLLPLLPENQDIEVRV